MFDEVFGQSAIKGVHVLDPAAVDRKLRAMLADGKDDAYVVSDFDLTLTTGRAKGENIGTWDVFDSLMTPEGVKRHTEIYASFRPIELAGMLTDAIAREKWGETLDLIASHRIREADIREAFLNVAVLREGAQELFARCKDHNVPTVILSSGIKNVIDIMAEHYELSPTLILSNDLVVDEEGRLSGWDDTVLIHILNKSERSHKTFDDIRGERKHAILLGDVPDDAQMVSGNDVLRIRILEPRKGERLVLDDALATSKTAGFDIAIEESLAPVVSLVDSLTTR